MSEGRVSHIGQSVFNSSSKLASHYPQSAKDAAGTGLANFKEYGVAKATTTVAYCNANFLSLHKNNGVLLARCSD